MRTTVAIVGAGLTAAAAAAGLRQEGFDGAIVVIGQEPHLPYERPPLSKEYVRAENNPEVPLIHDASWYDDNAIEARLGVQATRVMASQRSIELGNGNQVVADAVLLATGGRPRRLPGMTGSTMLSLRTVEDAQRIAEHLRPGRHIVLVGTGFIGAELAASARQRGAQVTAIEMSAVPLQHLLGPQMGSVIADLHREHGVDLRTAERVESITEKDHGVVVVTNTGAQIKGDAVIVGIGMLPNTEIAEASGIAVDNGIVVDEYCQTSQPQVYAAGDVANHYHPLFDRRLRVEHYDNAITQGTAAARNIMGHRKAFVDPHWFWSDQYDHNLQHTGSAQTWDDLIIRGSVDDRDFIAFYTRNGIVQAAFGLNRGRDVRAAKRLIAAGVAPPPAQLADPDVNLRQLLKPS